MYCAAGLSCACRLSTEVRAVEDWCPGADPLKAGWSGSPICRKWPLWLCAFAEDGRCGPHIAAGCGKRPRADDAWGREVRRFSEDGRSGFASLPKMAASALSLRPDVANGLERATHGAGSVSFCRRWPFWVRRLARDGRCGPSHCGYIWQTGRKHRCARQDGDNAADPPETTSHPRGNAG